MSISGGGSKRLLKKILASGLLVLATAIAVLVALVYARKDRTFDAPLPAITASTDPAVIARGRYLAYGPSHCVQCHGNQAAGRGELTFSGGMRFDLPIGLLTSANLTSDPVAGLGKVSDGAIARALRYGVDRDGHALLPLMPYGDMSDDDLQALLSFVRTLPPAAVEQPARQMNFLGKAVQALVLEPRGPSRPNVASVTPETTAEYGRYLANDVANCAGCHTRFSMATGKRTGPLFAGGMELPSHEANRTYRSPNLTPDPTGWLASWDEDAFVRRFQAGSTDPNSPMPWSAFARMTEGDLRAVYRYLKTVPPIAETVAQKDSVR